MTYAVQLAAVAERHAQTIDAWWRTHRLKAPDLFTRELSDALDHLSTAPHSGSPYAAPRPLGIRRLLLRKTGYHVYYSTDDQRALVTVRAIWHASRGRLPRL